MLLLLFLSVISTTAYKIAILSADVSNSQVGQKGKNTLCFCLYLCLCRKEDEQADKHENGRATTSCWLESLPLDGFTVTSHISRLPTSFKMPQLDG